MPFACQMLSCTVKGVTSTKLATDDVFAVVLGERELWAQPIVDVVDGAVESFELLSRWPGMSNVEALFERLSRSGGVVDVDLAGFEAAAAMSSSLRVPVSVNMTPLSLLDTAAVMSRLELSAVPSMLCVEVTEMAAWSPPVTDTIVELRRCGVSVMVDDVGTGWSNLDVLCSVEVDGVKLARQLAVASKAATSCRAALRQWVDDMGWVCVVEGVENAAMSQRLASEGFMLQQGYFWGRPAPFDLTAD